MKTMYKVNKKTKKVEIIKCAINDIQASMLLTIHWDWRDNLWDVSFPKWSNYHQQYIRHINAYADYFDALDFLILTIGRVFGW